MNYFKVDDIVRIKKDYCNSYSNSDYGNSNYRVIVIGGRSMFIQVVSLSTNKPAPIMGESPTRPCILFAMPLVVQAPDKFPFSSIAIMPMVS